MKDFIKNLQSEANKTVRRIETSEYNMMARALAVSRVLEEVFIRLKAFVSKNKFQDEKLPLVDEVIELDKRN